ncbi:Protein CBG27076 [Caenorhabditis briggsae]|uniref:Protein CBG27076 n=1 Tax=Caenorhabditis briggsae TaxID=6238 RepID=B6IHF2_CAEBR|nr:Protein CBG27076 [Caenorhabditis briggsae]CAR99332.1 Protein CBG27076 [Caenorhabditis briggsae]
MCSLNLITLLVVFFTSCATSEQLNEARKSCKVKKIVIPSGTPVLSKFIYLNYHDSFRSNVVQEECENLAESDSFRTKRSASVVWRAFAETAKKVGKPALKYSLRAASVGKKVGKYGSKAIGAGVKFASSDFASGILGAVVKLNRKYEMDSSEELVERRDREQPKRKEIQIFRRNLINLLDNNEIQGYILQDEQVQTIISKMVDGSKLRASDVECIKDDFTDTYRIRFRVEVDQNTWVKARRCNHPTVCPETALKMEACAAEFVQKCKKSKQPVDASSNVSRILPSGVVYYGNSNVLTLRRHNRTMKFRVYPHELEYFRISEGDEIWIGNDLHFYV